jgi:hypothetical protein
MKTISLLCRLIDLAASDAIGSIFQRNLGWVLRSGCATSKGSVHNAATQFSTLRAPTQVFRCTMPPYSRVTASSQVAHGVLATTTMVVAILAVLGCLAELLWPGRVAAVLVALRRLTRPICTGWRRGPRDATDLESGGRSWLGLVVSLLERCNKGSRIRVCIYHSTCGRYGSSRLGA